MYIFCQQRYVSECWLQCFFLPAVLSHYSDAATDLRHTADQNKEHTLSSKTIAHSNLSTFSINTVVDSGWQPCDTSFFTSKGGGFDVHLQCVDICSPFCVCVCSELEHIIVAVKTYLYYTLMVF